MLSQAVDTYLAVRRALGFQLKTEGCHLHSYARFADARAEAFIRTATTIEWATGGPSAPQRARRLAVVRRFARYLHAEDPRHDIPPEGLFGSESRPRHVPFIFSSEQLRRLLEAAARLGPAGSIRPDTYRTLFALLACTGLRIAEAINLRLQDWTADGLLIRESKFRKTRLVPLHATAQAALEHYRVRRCRIGGADDHLFVSQRGRRLSHSAAEAAFRTALQAADLDPATGRRPCLHSLRHTFAVRALESCPDGRDRIAQQTLALSTYLGHCNTTATYWYLEATPSLLEDIAQACERWVEEAIQ
ncbi:MAG: tyrosine-type recombinase/integrase [Nitrococcus mobilis]|jgi:integrase|nr:tyrosine-type recombinase/integrase [Nitrococcus mobilis]